MREAGTLLVGLILGVLFGYYVGFSQATMQTAPIPEPSVKSLLENMGTIIGAWHSADAQLVREFRDDGILIDTRGTEINDKSRWMLFTKEIPDQAFPGTLEDGVLYLAIAQTGEKAVYFKVMISDSDLALTPLEGTNVLTFKRN